MRGVLGLRVLGKGFNLIVVARKDVHFVVGGVIGSEEDEEVKKVFGLVYGVEWDVVLVGILVDLELELSVVGKQIS